METTPEPKKRFSLSEHPIVVGATVIGVIIGILFYFWSISADVYKARIEDLVSRLAERKDYEDRYHDEAVKRQHAETTAEATQAKLVEVTNALEALRSCKWQEQYETTKGDLLAARESLRLLEAQHDAMRKSCSDEKTDLLTQLQCFKSESGSTGLPAFDDLANEHMKLKRAQMETQAALGECTDQRARLSDQLVVANSQIADLKKLVAAAPTLPSNNQDLIKARVETLIASVQGLGDTDRVQVIAQGLKSIQGRFHVAYMLAMMNGMHFDSDKAKVAKATAPYLIYPVDPQSMQALIRTFTYGSDRSDALNALNEAELKQKPGHK